MALYHFTAKAVSFGKGQSAVHTAAYNARTQLAHDRESRITKNYADKGGLEFSGIFAPAGAPAWTQDREALWNRAEAAERQANGQPARNVEFALPHELNAEQRRRLVTDFARETFARRGMIADIAIHAPHGQNDERNFHVHCLLTMRKLDGDDFAKTKERAWNTKAELAAWKEKWAEMGARALERAGFATEAARFRHGHQTLPKQREAALERGDLDFAAGLDREATIHKGPAVSAMESRDDPRLATNETFQEARGIAERNRARAELRIIEQELAAARGEAVETMLPAVLRPEAPILAATAAEAAGGVPAGLEGSTDEAPDEPPAATHRVDEVADDLAAGLAAGARGIGKLADGVGALAGNAIDALANLFGGGASSPTQTPKQGKAAPMSATERRQAEHAAIIAAERMAHRQQLQETAKSLGYSPDTPMNEEELRRDQDTRRAQGHSR